MNNNSLWAVRKTKFHIPAYWVKKGRLCPGMALGCAGLLLLILCPVRLSLAAGMQLTPQPDIPVCSVTAGSGLVDFGSRSRGQLQSTAGGLTPGTRTITLSTGCTLSRVMKLRFDGPSQGDAFRWGKADSLLYVRAFNAQLDGTAVQLQRLNRAEDPANQGAEAQMLTPGDTLVAIKNGLRVKGRQLSITLEIVPVLSEQDSRPVQRTYPEGTLQVSLVP